MNEASLLYLWSDHAGTSTAIWMVLLITTMYFARTAAHNILRSTTRAFRNGLRLTARSIGVLEKRLDTRNRDVIVNMGKEGVERHIEREFHRVNAVVARDLSGYPAVQRKISDSINMIEEDYRNSAETPPSPPEWLSVIDSIAAIPRNGDPTVAKILNDIEGTLERAHKETISEFRKNSLKRHDLLKRMLPNWRSLTQRMTEVNSNVEGLEKRSKEIDQQMTKYENIRKGDDQALRSLSSSHLVQFFVSGLVLFIAVMGGIINFQLIALPMSEMVGGTSQLGPMRTADVAALVIIMVEVAMGLFLLESLRITRLFPVIGSMDDQMRRKMIVITFTILAILATVESSLAYMRDLLAADREALAQSLAGIGAVQAEFRWIPSIGQMVLGFILPFSLAFVAIPLESFIHSSRTALGIFLTTILRSVSFVLRLIGNLLLQLGHILIALYDIVIFLPLQIENLIVNKTSQSSASKHNTGKPADKVEEVTL